MSDMKFEKRCMLCGRTEEETGPMYALPGGYYVCKSCTDRTMEDFRKSGLTISDLMNMSKNLPSPEDISKLSDMAEKMGFNKMSFGMPGSWSRNVGEEAADKEESAKKAASDMEDTADLIVEDEKVGNDADAQTEEVEIVETAEEQTDGKHKDPELEFVGSFPLEGGDMDSILGSVMDAIKSFTGSDDDDEEEEEGTDGTGDGSSDEKKPKKKKKHINMMFMNPFGGLGGEQDKYAVKKKTEEEKEKERQEFDIRTIPAPHQIKAQLDEYVIGQDRAKKAIAVAVYNHYKRIYSDPADGIEIEKSNMMLIGPTGSGKTYLVKTLARLLDVPLAIADATSLTEAGYVGDDIESVISKLLKAADNDVDKAERGIVFIDEIDKLAKKRNMHSRDVSGESVQQELLKMLEGAQIDVPIGGSNKNMMVPTTTIDTNNILFICGGAFPELEGVITDRLTKHNSIGFGAEMLDAEHMTAGEKLSKVTTEDLRTFGMIPEFLGRLPVIVTLESLTEDFLVKILTEPKNAIIKQYKKLFAMDEVKLEFEEDALRIVARRALERETGARALRAVLEEFMQDIMYEIPKDPNIGEVIITADYLEKKGGPIIHFRGQD